MTAESGKTDERLTLWSAQAPVVIETLERDGVSFVKKAHIAKKYGESAAVFRTVYDFFSEEAGKRLPRPKEAESPIWVFLDKRRVDCSPLAWLLRLSIPRSEVILFDLRSFERILSLGPLGTEEERRELEGELRRQGIADASDVFLKPFYPALRKRIRDTWTNLFEDGAPTEETYTQGAVWSLREEWVTEKTFYSR